MSRPQTIGSTQAMEDDELIELVSIEPEETEAEPQGLVARVLDWAARKRGMLALVAFPTLVAAIYLFFIAAPRYQTEASFVVKSPSAAGFQLSSLLSDAGVRSNSDAFIVHAYIRSRDAVLHLAEAADLRARLSRPEADFLWRYPGLLRSDNTERLWKHFQSMVAVDFDRGTGITKLSVQGFRPQDAREIAVALLADSERLLNVLSARAKAETLRKAGEEVENSRARAREALAAVTEFRKRTSLVDPVKYSEAALGTITALAVEIARSNAELAELGLSSPDSPQAQTLRRRIAAVETQITKEREALAGKDTSLAPLIAEYERLMLEREFAERTFTSALTSLEVARVEAERQQLYLDLISAPSLPDYPAYPTRLLDTLWVLLGCWVVFALGRALLGDALSHAGK